jgi:hypothetical protein
MESEMGRGCSVFVTLPVEKVGAASGFVSQVA